jgi:hypothetical protein
MAVLGTKLDSLSETMKEFVKEQKTCNKDTDDRLNKVESAQVSFANFKAVVTWVGMIVGGALITFLVLVATQRATVTFP